MKHTNIHTRRSFALTKNRIALFVLCVFVLEMIPVQVMAVSSWNPTLLVNTESFQQIDSGDGTSTVDLRFGTSTSTLKLLTNNTFQFSKSLSVVGGLSGSYLTIDRQANISGSLLVKETITSKSTVSGANLTFMAGGASYVLGSLGVGKTSPATKLEVVGTVSGSRIRAQSELASSGTLVVRKNAGTGTGNILVVDTSGLVYNATNKRVGIGTAAPAYGILDIQGRVMTIGDTEATPGSRTDATTKWGQMVAPHYTNAEEPVHVVASYNSNGLNRIFIGGGLTSTYNAATSIQFATAETSTTTAGSERMRIDSTGNVGIGTTVPKSKLDVVGTISGSRLSVSGNANITGSLLSVGGITSRSTLSGANFTFMGATSSYVLGSLGVGKTAPATQLEVAGTISGRLVTQNGGGSNYFLGSVGIGTTAPNQLLSVVKDGVYTNDTGIAGAQMEVKAKSTTMHMVMGVDSTSDFAYIQSAKPGSDNKHLVLQPNRGNGRVGIGTTSPAASLSVSGSLIVNDAGLDNDVRMEGDTDANLFFLDASTDRIGIGTATPETKFEVVGTISGSRLSVSGNANITGSLLSVGGITSRSTISGANLTFMGATASYVLGSLGVGKTSPATQLEVAGTISGRLVTQNGGGSNYFLGSVGIGTTSPSRVFDLNGGAGGAVSVARFYSTGNTGIDIQTDTASSRTPTVRFRRSTGTLGSPLTVANADLLGDLTGYGHDGNDYETAAAKIGFAVDGAVSTNVVPGRIIFSTAPTSGSDALTERMRIDSAGNLGVATTAPKAKLDVVGTISGSRLSVSGNANITGSLLSVGGITSRSTLSGANFTFMGAISSYVLGSLGVGKTSPATQLEVVGTVSGSRIRAQSELASSGTLVVKKYAGTGTGNILTVDTSGLVYDATNKRVGIGTASPASKLTIIGDNTVTLGSFDQPNSATAITTGFAGFELANSNATASNWSKFAFADGVNQASQAVIASQNIDHTNNYGTLAFWTRGSGGSGIRLLIESNGNVGIGTTAPKAQLDVVGTISGSRLSVSGNANITGSLLSVGSITSRSTISGANLTFMGATSSYVLGSLGVGKTSPATQLEVAGTISGRLVTQNGGGSNYFMGSVGIGTTTPNASLDVRGDAYILNASKLVWANAAATTRTAIEGNTSSELIFYTGSPLTQRLKFDSSGNIIIGLNTASAGTSAVRALGIQNGTAPTTSPADLIQWYANDWNGAGTAAAFLRTEEGTRHVFGSSVGIGTITPKAQFDTLGTISGSRLSVSGNANITGSLLSVGGITSRSTISGANLTFMGATASYVLGSLGIGKTAPATQLEVAGTISGRLVTQNGAGSNYFMGNVGIGTGTTALSNPFHIQKDGIYANATTIASAQQIIKANANNMRLYLGIDSTSKFAYIQSTEPGLDNRPLVLQPNRGNGRVGIGTTSPAASLSVSGSLIVNDAGLDNDVRMEGDTDANLFFLDASTDQIGIGTGTPKAKLDVVGTISGSRLSVSGNANITGSLLSVGGITSRSTISGANLTFMGATASYVLGSLGVGKTAPATKLEVAGTISGRLVTQNGAGDNYFLGNVGIGTTAPKAKLDVFGTISGSRLSVSNNANISGALLVKGNVGIGTNAPGARLDLGLSPSTPGNLALSNYGYFGLQYSNGAISMGYNAKANETAASGMKVANTNGSVGYDFMVMDYNGGIRFHTFLGAVTAGDTASSERLRINTSGDIGIATISPKAKLDVVGTISGSRLSVSGNANITGSLLSVGGITSRSTISGASLTFMGATASYVLGSVGIGKSGTPNTKLEVVGTMSGTGLSIGGSSAVATKLLTATATLDFANIATANTCAADLTVSVPGAADGDAVFLGVPNGSVNATGKVFGWVSSANTVSVRYCVDGTTGDPASGTYRVVVMRF